MSYELFIGLRYLKAKRKQSFISVITFISILGITVGVTALIIVLSVMTGFEEDLKEKILGINAHIVVMELGGDMGDYADVAAKVGELGEVVGVTPFVYSQAMLSTDRAVVGVVVRGVELETFGDVTVLAERITEGSFEGLAIGFGDEAGRLPGIVIGIELAKRLGVGVGSEVNAISPTGSTTAAVPRMAGFSVVGIFDLGMYEYDSSIAFLSLENAQRFFRLHGTATGVEVKLLDLYRADEARESIKDALSGPYWIRTWKDMNRNLFSALKLEKTVMFIILMLIILVAALNIISTLIMVVMEKGKDIAILKSMGATSGGIMRIFMIEGIVIGLVGTFCGTVLGLVGAINLEWLVGILERVFSFEALPPSVYYIDRLPSRVEPSFVILIVIASIAISFIATLYPSWKASRFDPVEGLRYE